MSRRRRPLLILLAPAAVVLGLTAGPAAAAASNDPDLPKQVGLTEIRALEAWGLGRGGGVNVAVVSSGIAEHPDLKNKTNGGFDATGGGNPADDNDGRGTHLAGIVAAETNNSIGIAGTAPDAGLVPYKAYASDGSATGAQLKSALDNVLSDRHAVVLVDIPDGLASGDRATLIDSLRKLGQSGISVVAGAQNGVPLGDLPVLAVASTSGGADVGARGVAAPGGSVHSTTVTSTLALGDRFGYGRLSGTSQAAAHAAGALAILRGLGANATQAADLLRSTARKGSAGQGAGVIDVAAAAAAYKAPPPPPAAATTTTKKAAAQAAPKPGATVTSVPPAGPVLPNSPFGPLFTGEAVEPGAGEAAVVPPGAEEFAQVAETREKGPSILINGRERPWGTLTLGFGMLFGVGTATSLTFRRLAGPPT